MREDGTIEAFSNDFCADLGLNSFKKHGNAKASKLEAKMLSSQLDNINHVFNEHIKREGYSD